MGKRILVINPGSTSTKVAYYVNQSALHQRTIEHQPDDLKQYEHVADQFEYRKQAVLEWFEGLSLSDHGLEAVVGRGGILRPIPSGTYQVSPAMIEDLHDTTRGEHASNLGALIAQAIADEKAVPAYIVDPVAVDEFNDVARISGLKEITRYSLGHALNIRATSIRYAKEVGQNVSDLNLIVAHLGGGISVAAIELGRTIDINNANEMGPFSPERTGGLPVWAVAELIFAGRFKNFSECKQWLRGQGGVTAYLGTSDMRVVNQMIQDGDERAKLIAEAMAYQIGKEIGLAATVLSGQVDAILLTGGVAHNKRITDFITQMVHWIAPIRLYPGEDEMEALAMGTLRVLTGEEAAKDYATEVKRD
ncbi:MAG TPA: butyrate kinase [Tissierellia bacterium]|nr:butyrate kinase [Tissierellia bacterium]